MRTDYMSFENRGMISSSDDFQAHHISTMYFRHREPPGVSEKMWSVNLDASIAGEYQTLGGHSGPPWELLGSLMTGTGVPWE